LKLIVLDMGGKELHHIDDPKFVPRIGERVKNKSIEFDQVQKEVFSVSYDFDKMEITIYVR